MIRFIQHGTDGAGHQLYGLFSCMLLHNIKNYYFDGHAFVKKEFKFAHIDEKQCNIVKQYMIEIVNQFITHFKLTQHPFDNIVNACTRDKIPAQHNSNTIYSIDNAYYFDSIGMNSQEKIQHSENIAIIKKFFVNKFLPPNRLAKNNIVFHFRLGDALTTGRGDSIKMYNQNILKLIEYLSRQYKDHKCYLHTDGNIQFIIDKLKQCGMSYEIFDKSTPIMNVISDFIYAKIFVCGNSGLSKVCSFIGADNKLVITNDDNKHSMPPNTVKISSVISSKYGKTPYYYL